MSEFDIMTSVLVLSVVGFVAVYQMVRNVRYKEMTDKKGRILPYILVVVVVTMICDVSLGGDVWPRLLLDISLGLLSVSILTSSLWKFDIGVRMMTLVMTIQAFLTLYYILCAADVLRIVTVRVVIVLVLLVVIMMCMQVVIGIWYRIRSVRAVMKSGTVWIGLCLCVEVVYVLVLVSELMGYFITAILTGTYGGIAACILVVLYASSLVAMSSRIIYDSVFVFLHKHERRIVESLKVSQIEASGDSGKGDYQYREIYERIVAYFENEKPYLNGDLTINDLVKVLYSNKLYISKAISHFTGRNFCQFVNYHRVRYSIEKFRDNPDLKVLELSSLCGFNSIVSYAMAFRLFMGETPSEWCRKERSRIIKGRK